MNFDLNEANTNNLTNLWKKMGTEQCSSRLIPNINISANWPNRCWFDWKTNLNEISKIENIISLLDENSVVPVWNNLSETGTAFEQVLVENEFELFFEQTAMYLDLENYHEVNNIDLEITEINSDQDIKTWTSIASSAFEYQVDESVIQKIATDSEIKLLLGIINGQPVTTGLLFKTGDSIGVHLVGVPKEFRGKGFARKMMQSIIEQCYQWKGKYITLQASIMGESLYKSLGFKEQFTIKNYQRTIKK
jgi:GNAT superfamily N-acetyltransferase